MQDYSGSSSGEVELDYVDSPRDKKKPVMLFSKASDGNMTSQQSSRSMSKAGSGETKDSARKSKKSKFSEDSNVYNKKSSKISKSSFDPQYNIKAASNSN